MAAKTGLAAQPYALRRGRDGRSRGHDDERVALLVPAIVVRRESGVFARVQVQSDVRDSEPAHHDQPEPEEPLRMRRP